MKKQYNFSKAKRGPVLKVPRGKSRITIRLDDDILDWFRKRVDEAEAGATRTSLTGLSARTSTGPKNLWKPSSGEWSEELRRAS